MTKKELDKKKCIINRKIGELRDELDTYVEEYINDCCPVKIGDVVICNGWSNEGKKMQVTKISMHKCKGDFVCRGPILKKDGSISVRVGEHFCNCSDK